MKLIKIITFYIGVDVLGFPLTHNHKLIYRENLSKIKYQPPSLGRKTKGFVSLSNVFKNKNQLEK